MQNKIIGYRAELSYTLELYLDNEEDKDYLEGMTWEEIQTHLTEELLTLDGCTIAENTEVVPIYETEEVTL